MVSEQFFPSSFERAAQEVEKLSADGFLGFFDRFEVTEVVAIRNGQTPINMLSLFVAEDGRGAPLASLRTLGERLRCKEMRDWTFGVFRYELSPAVLAKNLMSFSSTRTWSPSGKSLELGVSFARPSQFVPVDSIERVPLNSILKNNFWNGSHVIELVDNKKASFSKLYDDPSILKNISPLVEQQVPIGISGLSDQLGNILIQIPVTVAMTSFGKSRDSDSLFVDVSWHERATPRPLRASCEIAYDGVVSAFAVADVKSGQASLPLPHTDRAFLARLWDAADGTLLSASGPSAFIKQIALNMSIIAHEPRVFMVPERDGCLKEQRITIQSADANTSVIGETSLNGLEWTDRRLYKEDIRKRPPGAILAARGARLVMTGHG